MKMINLNSSFSFYRFMVVKPPRNKTSLYPNIQSFFGSWLETILDYYNNLLLGKRRWSDESSGVCKSGPHPQYGWDFPEEIPEKFRKDPGNALRAFPGIPVKSTAGMPPNPIIQGI